MNRGGTATGAIFFFGTLMDAELRRLVLGGDLASDQIETGAIGGFRRVRVAGRDYPMLVPHPTGRVVGVLARKLGGQALRRLVVYEGAEYRLVRMVVADRCGRSILARVFLADPRVRWDPRSWRLETWQRRHKRNCLRRIGEAMAGYQSRAMLRGWRPVRLD